MTCFSVIGAALTITRWWLVQVKLWKTIGKELMYMWVWSSHMVTGSIARLWSKGLQRKLTIVKVSKPCHSWACDGYVTVCYLHTKNPLSSGDVWNITVIEIRCARWVQVQSRPAFKCLSGFSPSKKLLWTSAKERVKDQYKFIIFFCLIHLFFGTMTMKLGQSKDFFSVNLSVH